MPAQFVWSEEEIRRVGSQVVDLVARHLASLPDQPVFRPFPRAAAEQLLAAPLPEQGQSADQILDLVRRDIASHPFGNGHPRFYGWVNSPPAVIGIMAEMVAAAMNPSVAGGNHAAVWVERQVLEWFKALLGFPAAAMGLLVSGASSAAITALGVARHAACARRGCDVRAIGVQGVATAISPGRLLVYKSAEGHSCHQKAAELLGLGREGIRLVGTDAALRMDPVALDQMLEDDLAAGHLPVAVLASAGTVNTGAIDPLQAIADVCARHGVWLHVDGAYGGPAILTEQYRSSLAPLGRADSVAIDPHKWLYVPVDAGLVLVRDAAVMRDAFSLIPPYLRSDDNPEGVQGPPWFSEFGTEQTRPFRALKVWMALRYFGLHGYRELIARDIAHAGRLANLVRQAAGFRVWEPQGLSVVCFRAAPAELGGDGRREDDLNRTLLTDLQLGGEVFLSSATLGERLWLRACFVNPRASESDVDRTFHAVRTGLERRLAAPAARPV